VDIALLGILEGARAVGIYSVAVGASELVKFVGDATITSQYGRVGRLEPSPARRATTRLAIGATVVAAVQAVPLALVAHPAMAFVFGPDFRVSGDYVVVLLIGAVVGAPLLAIANYFTNQLGRPGIWMAITCVVLAATIVFCLILIPLVGTIGAAMGSALGTVTATAVAVVVFRRGPRSR
jgi:O-antigen/teichoic acid export membrane protein